MKKKLVGVVAGTMSGRARGTHDLCMHSKASVVAWFLGGADAGKESAAGSEGGRRGVGRGGGVESGGGWGCNWRL